MVDPLVDWLGGDYAFDYSTPVLPTLSSPSAPSRAERDEPPSGEETLPLLRLRDRHSDRQYDKSQPHCIHYDLCGKVCQRDNIRARQIYTDSDLDLVVAPGDFWETDLRPRLERLGDKSFPSSLVTVYAKETNVVIAVQGSDFQPENQLGDRGYTLYEPVQRRYTCSTRKCDAPCSKPE